MKIIAVFPFFIFLLFVIPAFAMKQIILTSGAGTGDQTWTVPAGWNSSSNKIECIGSGGDGASASGTRVAGLVQTKLPATPEDKTLASFLTRTNR